MSYQTYNGTLYPTLESVPWQARGSVVEVEDSDDWPTNEPAAALNLVTEFMAQGMSEADAKAAVEKLSA